MDGNILISTKPGLIILDREIYMTEDDTFNALRKVPLVEMIELWQRSPIDVQPRVDTKKAEDVRKDIRDFFKSYGWEYLDFNDKWYQYLIDRGL